MQATCLCRTAGVLRLATTPSARKLVEGAGFEPAKAEPADLQSAPVDRLGTPPRCEPRIVRPVQECVNSQLREIQGFFAFDTAAQCSALLAKLNYQIGPPRFNTLLHCFAAKLPAIDKARAG